MYGFAGGIFGLMSINTLAAISMDRHYVITNPLQAARTMTKRRSMMYVLFVWIYSAIWSSPPLFGWGGKYKPDGFQTSCTFDYVTQDTGNYIFNLCMYSFSFAIPVMMIFYCYTGIVKEMFKHGAEMRKQASKMGATMAKGDQDKKTEFKTAKISAVTVATFLLSWTPYAIIGICGLVFPHEDKFVTPMMSEIAVMFAKASAAYNPVIYALSHPKFQIELHKRFPFLMCCCKPVVEKSRYGSQVSVTRTSGKSSVTGISENTSSVDMDVGSPNAIPTVSAKATTAPKSPTSHKAGGQCS